MATNTITTSSPDAAVHPVCSKRRANPFRRSVPSLKHSRRTSALRNRFPRRLDSACVGNNLENGKQENGAGTQLRRRFVRRASTTTSDGKGPAWLPASLSSETPPLRSARRNAAEQVGRQAALKPRRRARVRARQGAKKRGGFCPPLPLTLSVFVASPCHPLSKPLLSLCL